MRLDTLDWPAAVRAVQDLQAADHGPSRRILADVESLSALFTSDCREGMSRIRQAERADPFNPLHPLRVALLLLRFGEWQKALVQCQSIQDSASKFALPIYLRALTTFRQEEFKRAGNIAQDAITAQPGFALAKFLQAEALQRTAGKNVKKALVGLPRGPGFAPAWADLLVKWALSGNEEALKLCEQIHQDPKALPADSKAKLLADFVMEVSQGKLDGIESPAADSNGVHDAPANRTGAPSWAEPRIAGVRAGSRAEEVLLLLIHDRLQKEQSAAGALDAIRHLHERLPERHAIRRLFAGLLTRRAMADTAAERYADALRLVDHCRQLEPHETIHFQNRAALFTLMREPEAYHDAWFELNRHQYRRALLGEISPHDALKFAKPHRLFAEQARSSSSNPDSRQRQDLGIFAQDVVPREDGSVGVTINQDRINDDPDLLRQWMVHRRAELVFAHWALGRDPRRFLLNPDGRRGVKSRLSGLALSTQALQTLVPGEGRLLGERLLSIWTRRAANWIPEYVARTEDPAVFGVQSTYVETFADIAFLCLSWRPDGQRPDLVEELLEFLDAMTPFFDDRVMRLMLKTNKGAPGHAIKVLASYSLETLGLDDSRSIDLTDAQRTQVAEHLAARLLATLAYRIYDVQRGAADSVQRSLALLERARQLDPGNIYHQLTTTRFLVIGGYYGDARRTLAQLQRLPKGRDPEVANDIEELRKIILKEAKADEKAPRYEAAGVEESSSPIGQNRIGALEREIDSIPTAIHSYEDLARALASAGRFQDALDWSDRAMAQCLEREAQLRARSLNLELLGLEQLAKRDQNVVRLYLTGAHRPALGVIESVPAGLERSWPMLYLMGQCLLALNRPEEARQAFELALGSCERQMHRPVLRRLASDVDQAYLIVARRGILDHLGLGAFEAAQLEAIDMLARLQRPEVGFLDLARVHLEAATTRLGTEHQPLPRPTTTDRAHLNEILAKVYASQSDLERAHQLVTLSRRANPATGQQADQMAQKIEGLRAQEETATALVQSAACLKDGKVDDALARLEGAPDKVRNEPRIQRQRALILLKLGRFDEADALAATQGPGRQQGAEEFQKTYPTLAFRQRLAAAIRLIRSGSDDQAVSILAGAKPATPGDVLEVGYCKAFCKTMQGYRERRQGQAEKARQSLNEALVEVEVHLPAARGAGHKQLLELYATLDDELARERE